MTESYVPRGRSSWGRWGVDDQRGALNLLTPQVVMSALGEVREGKVLSLAMRIQRDGVPVYPARNPSLHLMALDGGDYEAGARLKLDNVEVADDYIFMGTGGSTHMDGLSHIWYDEYLYNGVHRNRIRSYGATKMGIEHAEWLVTRGVHLDVAALHGVDHLPKGHAITADEMEACCKASDVEVRSGDGVLVRTGWLKVYAEDPLAYFDDQPGLRLDAAEWLADRDISVVLSDNQGIEWEGEDGRSRAVHKLLIRDMGIYMVELLDLEPLHLNRVRTCALVVAPLKITGAIASPVNPLAII